MLVRENRDCYNKFLLFLGKFKLFTFHKFVIYEIRNLQIDIF